MRAEGLNGDFLKHVQKSKNNGDLKSRLVIILNCQKEVGWQMVQILNGI